MLTTEESYPTTVIISNESCYAEYSKESCLPFSPNTNINGKRHELVVHEKESIQEKQLSIIRKKQNLKLLLYPTFI